MTTLFKRSLKGIEVWCIDALGGKITTTWGMHEGKQTPRIACVKKKNVGKANETSLSLQADKEMQSKITKKIDREGYYSIEMLNFKWYKPGYYLPVSEMEAIVVDEKLFTLNQVLEKLPLIGNTSNGSKLPMLAKPYYRTDKEGNKIPTLKLPHFIQPKINGVRCETTITLDSITMESREGAEFLTLEGFKADILEEVKTAIRGCVEEFKSVYTHLDATNLTFDGELYIHDTILSDIVGCIKKSNLLTQTLQYHIYDLMDPIMTQHDRLVFLKRIATVLRLMNFNKIVIVDTMLCKTYDDAERMCDVYIKQGYEGLIGRTQYATYQMGARSKDLAKLKRRMSGEFKIVDVYDTSAAPGLAMFKCKNDINNEFFEVVPQGTHEKRREYLENRSDLLGKMLTAEYYERTKAPKKLPFHATGIVVRDYE